MTRSIEYVPQGKFLNLCVRARATGFQQEDRYTPRGKVSCDCKPRRTGSNYAYSAFLTIETMKAIAYHWNTSQLHWNIEMNFHENEGCIVNQTQIYLV